MMILSKTTMAGAAAGLLLAACSNETAEPQGSTETTKAQSTAINKDMVGANTEGNKPMEIMRKTEMEAVEGPAEFFTGKATITGQFGRANPSRLTGALVRFEPGARSAWHKHPLGQTLIVTEGIGWTQIEGGEREEFSAGDIIWCPPNIKHWHGATPNGAMAHYAIQEALDGENVVWVEKVTDEQYNGG